jgi:thiol-disulfide isomerase/thioredoxin
MKNILLISFCLLSNIILAQVVTLSPPSPEVGKAVKIMYDANGGPLQNHEVQAVVYELVFGSDPIAYDVALQDKSQGTYTASFTPTKDADALLIRFINDDESVADANDKMGYFYKLHSNGKVINNSNAAIAETVTIHRRKVIIEEQTETAKICLRDELKLNPKIADNPDYLMTKALIARATSDDDMYASVMQYVDKAQAKANANETELMDAAQIAFYAGNRGTYEKISGTTAAAYPEGKAAIRKKLDAFHALKDITLKEKAIAEYEKMSSSDPQYQIGLESMASNLATYYGQKNNAEKLIMYAAKIKSPTTKASMYNNVAWTLSGESIDATPINAKLAEEISKESLNLIAAEKTAMTMKPVFQSKARYGNNMSYNYAMYSDTYALLAHHLGMKEDALKYQTLAVEAYDYKDGDMNTRYAIYMEEAKGGQATMPFLEKMIVGGNASTGMKSQYERIFKSDMDADMAYEKVLILLEKEAKAKHIEAIKESLFVEAPKDFALVNLDGENVSLDSMKGKVVVLDFWATWCGPCKASFPGMQNAVDKYADNPLVEFLFIDTWEKVDNKESNAKAFLESKGYRFNVLMDNENKMVQSFGISGIPTKYILDQSGQLRYKSVGYDGNDAKLVDELSIVIDVLLGEQDRASIEP